MDTNVHDVIVIGAGPVGERRWPRGQGGLTAAIVERGLVGGECSYWACMPTRSLLGSASSGMARALLCGCVPPTLRTTMSAPSKQFLASPRQALPHRPASARQPPRRTLPPARCSARTWPS
jgi:hypothetical protein